MQAEKRQLPAGLYLVPTPIGNARDITLRALDVLASADVLAAEDTRNLRHLLDVLGVKLDGRRIVSWHDHSSDGERARLIEVIRGGAALAYSSDAGMPVVSDPGFTLVRAAVAAGVMVTALPGPSAATTALALSGLPAEQFQFLGFPPTKAKARAEMWQQVKSATLTSILYESPKRVGKSVKELMEVMGPERPAALCRELTKKFEEVIRGTLGDLDRRLSDGDVKGEIVLVVGRAEGNEEFDIDAALVAALDEHSVRDAAELVAAASGLAKRDLYQRALALKGRGA